MSEITSKELEHWKRSGKDFQLIDVREPFEHKEAKIKGELIPLCHIEEAVNRIATDQEVVIYCCCGRRSVEAIRTLETKYGFKNLYNLKGGLLAYAREVD
ncbi:MAG: rhodanese-like domain-containing protein [Cytophagales bacterium]|nr:rhodanese-like domain-containing protein [Cytophagales bacterium]